MLRPARVIEYPCALCETTVQALEFDDPDGVFAAAVETERARLLCAPCFAAEVQP